MTETDHFQHRRSSVKKRESIVVTAANKINFGKVLAGCMVLSLIFGIFMLIMGYCIQFRLGTIIQFLTRGFRDKIDVTAATSNGQNIIPVGEIPQDIDLGDWTRTLSALLISSAIITLIFSVLGIYAGLSRNKILLAVTAVAVLVTVFILLFLISIAASSDMSFHEEARNDIQKIIRREFKVETENNPYIFTFNTIMLKFECCGARGGRDFINLTFYEKTANPNMQKIYIFDVAPACCKKELFNGEIKSRFLAIKSCAIKGYMRSESFNYGGCYNAVFRDVQNHSTASLAVTLTWDILVMVLAIMTIMDIRQEEQPRPPRPSTIVTERKVVPPREERPPMHVVKKFLPYAKISSFSHPDITRIKSTEIW